MKRDSNMRRDAGRRGSALLIVLGMFAFMLVSAVAFSIYMRASRAPSSFLRRNTATRQLVRAALARAIDEVDTAIGNDPFPGVGYNHDYQTGSGGGLQGNRAKNDNWHGRVFVPSNEVALAETVSTITLEGLGYIPSILANEARYWSRHTRTAKWHPFNFGMGRYAFTAINVTDFFDVNAFVTPSGGQRRQYLNRSSAPHGRVSPAYLFRGGDTADMDSGGAAASAFLNVIAGGAGVGGGDYPSLSDVPFTSFMDLNLAMAQAGNSLGGMASPYVHLIKDNNTSTFLSGNEEAARRTLFVAGGWNSDSNLTYEAYKAGNPGRINLRYGEFQPFDGCSWFPDATTLAHCYNDVAASHPFWQPFNNNFPIISTALLCDYLDTDNVPLSLCIPCVEAVPMLCGVELNDNCVKYSVSMVETELQAANPEQGTKKKIKRTYSFSVTVDGLETALTAVYPFFNGPQGHAAGYTAEAFARIFFVAEPSGTGLNDSGLRTSLAALGTMDAGGSQWDWSGTTEAAYIQATCGDASITAEAAKGVGDAAEESAVRADIAMRMANSLTKDAMLAELVYEVDESGKETLVDAECVNGTGINFYDASWSAMNFLEELKNDSHPDLRFRPSVAVWARIRNAEGKTVDMVPAVPANDNLNGFADNATLNGFSLAAGGEAGTPLLRFFPKVDDKASGILLTKEYFKNNSGANREAQWKQKAYIANDPRINWAPEQWWATDSTTNPRDLWLQEVRTFRGDSIRDRDISMSASDQGYLQSMYEWMMIPQVRELFVTGNPEWGAFEGGSGYDGVVNTAIGDVAHRSVMWRTYRSDAIGADNTWGSIDGLAFDDAENGLRVNPYTDMMPVMLGAFANMPCDWWSAGTNHTVSGKSYMDQNSPTFENGYLFEWSCRYSDVYNMAYYWMEAFNRKELAEDQRQKELYLADAWKDVVDSAFNWLDGEVSRTFSEEFPNGTTLDTAVLSGNSSTINSILGDMTFTERKFLYSYLQGCFANTAQLFLMFVRAEASSGGAEGSGGRAVALVWRDPSAPMENGQFRKSAGGTEAPQYGKDNAGKYLNVSGSQPEESWRLKPRDYPPHRTRVLFYHQLD